MQKRVVAAGVCGAAAVLAASSLHAAVERRDIAGPRADIEVVSVAADHTELAPDTTFTLTYVVRSRTSAVGPFSVGVYLARGAAAGDGLPRDARMLAIQPVDRGLPKGGSATFSTEVRVPRCADCGAFSVYVVADPANRTVESNEANNVRGVTLDVAADHLPDLRVDTISVTPDRGSTSDTVTVRAKLRNASRYVAHGPFRVSVYCSADSEITPSDHRLFSFTVPSMGAAQSIGLDRAVALAPSCGVRALTTWIGVLVDDEDEVRESSKQNDAKAAPFWVFRAPDLTARQLFTSATSGPPGARVLVSYKISNQGGSAAGSFRSSLFLSKSAADYASGALLDEATLPSLAANVDSGAIEHAVTIPGLARGRYYLAVVVDPDGANGELRKRNNFRAVPFDVTDVNLTDAHFSASPRDVAPGDTLSLRLAVRNTGLDPAPASKVAFYYSDDPRFDVERDVRLGEIDLGPVAKHATSKESALDVVVPKDAREGYHFVLAVIDDLDGVAETNEHDNVALEAIRISTSE